MECSTCRKTGLTTDDFHLRTNGYMFKQCRKCRANSTRINRISRTTGLTRQEILDFEASHPNLVCEICGNPESRNCKISYDHCHNLGKPNLRGILCSSCNNLIGLAKDDITILLSAIKYLSQ